MQTCRRTFLSFSLAALALPVMAKAARPRRVGLVLLTGNSHSIGWAQRQAGDRFSSRVLQVDRNGQLNGITAGILNAGDKNPAFGNESVGPSLSFLNGLAAQRPDLDAIVAVARGQGSTGFVRGKWDPAEANRGNLLQSALRRWNSAYVALLALGCEVEPIAAAHLSSRPDVDTSDPVSLTERAREYALHVDAYVDFVRANLKAVPPDFPVIISAAMTQMQVRMLGAPALTFLSSAHGVAWRKARTWFMDPINDWGDGEAANLPVHSFDGTHADRNGVLTEGRLLLAGLQKAWDNRDPRLPFSGLPETARLLSLYDFRAGGLTDLAGREDIEQGGATPDIVGFSSVFGTFAFHRDGPGGSGYLRRAALPARFSIVLRLCFADTRRAHTLLTTGGPLERPLLVVASGALVVPGHGGEIAVPLTADDNQPVTVALTCDGKQMSLIVDGVVQGRVAAPADAVESLRLFPANATADVDFRGQVQCAAIFGDAVSPDLVGMLARARFAPSR